MGTLVRGRECPKCGGRLIRERYLAEYDEYCIACGWRDTIIALRTLQPRRRTRRAKRRTVNA